jgi:transcription-repair coupling factor (superfamily II helicase)
VHDDHRDRHRRAERQHHHHHRADKFGLAQLHQLRGRVGRSHHQAYAYLLVHDPQSLTKQAQRRLEAIQQMEELGSGFYLAMHDLEIRGAGEVLGDKQSGEIHEIGFQLYTDMLNDAVKALKNGKEPDLTAPLAATTEINLHAPAILPADYCADVQERLSLYKRLANCEHGDAIDGIQEELIDRFGKLPPQAQALVETHRLRLAAKPLGIVKIDASEARSGCSSSRTRRSIRCASSSWCRSIGTSSSPGRTSCASRRARRIWRSACRRSRRRCAHSRRAPHAERRHARTSTTHAMLRRIACGKGGATRF